MRDNGDPKPLPPQVCKGRGALSNSSGRFEAETREAFDDGWGSLDELPARVPTTLSLARPRPCAATSKCRRLLLVARCQL